MGATCSLQDLWLSPVQHILLLRQAARSITHLSGSICSTTNELWHDHRVRFCTLLPHHSTQQGSCLPLERPCGPAL